MPPTSRFTPLLAAQDGGQAETLGAGATPLAVLFAVPASASSLWLQATGGADIEYRLDGALVGAGWLVLPAFSVLPLSNRPAIDQLVLRSPSGNTTVAVAFSSGSTGPIPPIPAAATTGGIIPPPPPGLSAVRTPNVLHVMPAPVGNDATGAPYRLDLPYASLLAAVAAASIGDTINVWAGTYTVANVVAPGMTINLLGAELQDNGIDPIFAGDAGGAPMAITGTGMINAVLGAQWAIDIINQSAFLLDVPVVGDNAIRIGGNQDCLIRATITATNRALQVNGKVRVYADVVGQIFADVADYNVVVRGNVSGNADVIDCSQGAYVEVRGDVSASIGPAWLINGGRCIMYGDTSSDGAGVVLFGNGYMEHHGDIRANTGEAWFIRQGASLYHYGDATSGAEWMAICEDGSAYVVGNMEAAQNGVGGIQVNDASASVRFRGRIETDDVVGISCQAGSIQFDGDVITNNAFGASILAGTMRLQGYMSTGRSCVVIEDSTAAFTVILGEGLTLVSGDITSVLSIDGNPCNVLVYQGVGANVGTNNIVQLIKTVDVNALYQ